MTDPTLTPEVYGPDHAHPQGLAAAKASMDAAPLTECFDRGNMPWRESLVLRPEGV